MALEELRISGFGLLGQVAPEEWQHRRIKPEPLDPVDAKVGDRPRIVEAASIGEFLQRSQPTEESRVELYWTWEAQWQEFLRKLESPHSGWGTPQLPGEPTPWDDTRAFLASFEQVAEACQWPREEWAARLQPALRGEAEQAFNKLEARDQANYRKVKATILRGAAMRREKQRQHFRRFCYQQAEGPRGAYSQLQKLCHQWLRVEKCSKTQILELLLLEQLLSVLPLDIQKWVRERSPETCAQAVILAEVYLQRQEEAVRWRQWEPTALVSCPEAEQGPPDTGQKPLDQEVKEEVDDIDVSFQADSRHSGESGREKEQPGIPEQAGPSQRVPQKTMQEAVSQREEQGGSAKYQHRPKRMRKKRCRNRTGASVTCLENEKAVVKTTQQQKPNAQPEPMEDLREDSGHLICDRSPFQCTKNGLGHRDLRVSHQRVPRGSGLHQCSSCGKTFSQSSQLALHERLHTGLQPYQCSHCPKAFRQRYQWVAHERTHTGKNLCKCSYCGIGFSRNWLLVLHEKSHAARKLYKCLYCGKSFNWKSQCIVHERTHAKGKPWNGEKPYKCSVCEQSFTHHWLLAMHEGMHTGEKSYECVHCGKKFYSDTGLNNHRRFHAAEMGAA